jgi:hypothetical protein
MTQASEIISNLPRSTQTYDQEMRAQQSYARPPEFRPDEEVRDLDELTCMRFEDNYAAAEAQRIPDQDRFMGVENQRRRFVNFMHPHKFFRQLRRAGVDARVESPHFYVWVIDDETGKLIQRRRERTIGRLWLHDDVVQDRVGISAWVWNQQTKVRERRHVTWMQWPYGPEWSLLTFDQYDVPTGERWRGWRTALLHLILADVITEREASKAFGPVQMSDISIFYRQQLFQHRKRRAGLIQ